MLATKCMKSAKHPNIRSLSVKTTNIFIVQQLDWTMAQDWFRKNHANLGLHDLFSKCTDAIWLSWCFCHQVFFSIRARIFVHLIICHVYFRSSLERAYDVRVFCSFDFRKLFWIMFFLFQDCHGPILFSSMPLSSSLEP